MNSKNSEAHIFFSSHDGTIAVWPNPNGPMADLFGEVTVEVQGQAFRRPVVWVFRPEIPFGYKFEPIHGTREDWEALKRLMRLSEISYEEIPGEYVPCARNYQWYPPTAGSEEHGQWGWYPSDAAQLRIRGPLMIFR